MKLNNMHEREVLHYIVNFRDVDRRDISQHTGISPRGIIGILSRLKNNSLIKEEHDSHNERKKNYVPTKEGIILIKLDSYKKEIIDMVNSENDLDKICNFHKLISKVSIMEIISEGLNQPDGLLKSDKELKNNIIIKRLEIAEQEIRRLKNGKK